MTEFERMAVETALREMFSKGHFCICTVDKCLEITGAIADRRTYRALSALHCVDYSAMAPDLRSELLPTVMGLFADKGFDVDLIRVEHKPDESASRGRRKGGLLRLLGGGA